MRVPGAGRGSALGLIFALPLAALAATDTWERPLPIFADSVRVSAGWMDGADVQTLLQQAGPASGLDWIALGGDARQSAASAQIAVLQAADGLVVLGRADGAPAGEWTLQWSTLTTLRLPPVGWQRAPHALDSDAQCDGLGLASADRAACPHWRRAQLQHRERLRQAFRPSWRLGAGGGVAQRLPDWSALARQAGFDALDPAAPGPWATQQTAQQTRFVLALPWTAWPPAAAGILRRVYLQARYCRGDAGCVGAPAAADAALELELARPLTLQPDACGQSLSWPLELPWYLRIADSLASAQAAGATRAFAFDNPGGGYLDRPDPARISPELRELHYQTRPIDDRTWLCLPEMRLWRPPQPSVRATALSGDQVLAIAARDWPAPTAWTDHRHPYWREQDPAYVAVSGGAVDLEFAERVLDDGRRLWIEPYRVDPPRSGEGNNGACDSAHFALWILRPGAPGLRLALRIDDHGPDLCAGSGLLSAILSDDGRRVDSVRQREFEADPAQLAEADAGIDGPLEIHQRHCLDDATDSYLPCGRRVRALLPQHPPPAP